VKASTITADERALFEEQGFLIRRAIFTGATLSALQDDALAVAAAFDENYGRITLLEATAAQQSSHNLVNCLAEPELLDVSEDLCGNRLRMEFPYWMNLNTPSMYWHRDLDFIPYDKVSADFNLDDWHLEVPFSQIQWNLVLIDDSLLWVVPGSHRRKPTAGEARALGLKDYTAAMPGKVNVALGAGDGVVFNNNILHGVRNPDSCERRTLHWCWVNAGAYNPWMNQCPPLREEERNALHPRLVAMAAANYGG